MGDSGLKDLSSSLGTEDVCELLLQLEYPAEVREAKTGQIISEYRDNAEQPILGLQLEGMLVGLVGLALRGDASAVIRHIVVRRSHRRRGIGRRMIEAVRHKYGLKHIFAEIDRDALDFYRKCGFEVTSLGEKYPGTERFWCTLTGSPQQDAPADADKQRR